MSLQQQQLLSRCDSKVFQLLTRIHQHLNLKFPFIQQSRQLSAQESQLLLQITNQTVNYKILVAVMAIDTYTDNICQIFTQADTLLQTLAVCLSCVQKMKNQLEMDKLNSQFQTNFNNLYHSIINMTESASLFNPNSPFLQLYRSVISNQSQDLAESIYTSLKQQNNELKERLRLNDKKIMDLEIKLIRILQQNQGYETPIQATMKYYELKDELQKKQLEIERMNEQFCYEIEKYNVVYETLKRQLDQYKSYEQNVETVQLIQKLQTEIVVLRQQKERQQMINEQLRKRLQILSESTYIPEQIPSVGFKRSLYYNRPGFHQRDDSYQQYSDSDYYTTQSQLQYDTQNQQEQLQMRNNYDNRFTPSSRGYNQWLLNQSDLQNEYRY